MDYSKTHLMAAKICHDIATPLSAMNLLLDFAFEHCKDPHIEATFRESLEKASIRLQFYRLLLTINEDQPSYPDVFTLLGNCAKILKIRLELPVECPDGAPARLLLGLTYILMETLTHGGTVTVIFQDDTLILSAQGTPLQLRPGYIDALEKPDAVEKNSRNILPIYLANLAQSLRVSLKIKGPKDDQIHIETYTLQ